jgi:hypothetical protein
MLLGVALPGISRFEVQGSMLDVGCWMFGVQHKPSESNFPPYPTSGWSRGRSGQTLDI